MGKYNKGHHSITVTELMDFLTSNDAWFKFAESRIPFENKRLLIAIGEQDSFFRVYCGDELVYEGDDAANAVHFYNEATLPKNEPKLDN